MTLDEKTAGRAAAVTNAPAFSDVVDSACQKLMDRQVKHSIQRIQEMRELLAEMEKELDDFLCEKENKTKSGVFLE